MQELNGILLINKPIGMTSHDVVFQLRKLLKIKKIGHSGTLDPDASGVLCILIGKACKILPFLKDTDKEYIAQMKLGIKTISDDIFTEVLDTKEIKPIENFQEILDTFKGKSKQLPPMISSIKINGKKLYEYARNHETVDIPLRDIEIYDIEALDVRKYEFRVHCSSGTYVRSICRDIGEKTGNYACMSALQRTRVGRFTLDDCCSLDSVAQGNFQLHPICELLDHYPMIQYEDIQSIYQGKTVKIETSYDEVLIIDQGDAIAIYKRHHGNYFSCVRGLW